MKKTVLKSAGAGAEAPVAPARWEEGEKTMIRVGNVLNDTPRPAQAALMIDVMNSG